MSEHEGTAHGEDVARLRDAAEHIGASTIHDGSWFRRMVSAHMKKHFAELRPEQWERQYPRLDVEERAHAHVRSRARRASAAGAVAGIGASSGELLSLATEGLGAVVGVPALVLSMMFEAWYTTLLQIDLACDLASIYGVPFDSDDVGEVATLFGLSLGVEVKDSRGAAAERDEPEEPEGDTLTEKLLELKEGEIASRIGRKLLEDAVMRNVVPFISVPLSSYWNYVATKKLGATVRKYMRYRRALAHAFHKLDLAGVARPELLVEGAWLLATVDGAAGHEEVLALALIMDKLLPAQRAAIEFDKTLGDDEEEWFAELAAAPESMRGPLIDTLSLVAATDRELQPGERRFLRRVAKALGRDIDCARVAQMAHYFAGGRDLPDGMFTH